jgi:hypothetical protein
MPALYQLATLLWQSRAWPPGGQPRDSRAAAAGTLAWHRRALLQSPGLQLLRVAGESWHLQHCPAPAQCWAPEASAAAACDVTPYVQPQLAGRPLAGAVHSEKQQASRVLLPGLPPALLQPPYLCSWCRARLRQQQRQCDGRRGILVWPASGAFTAPLQRGAATAGAQQAIIIISSIRAVAAAQSTSSKGSGGPCARASTLRGPRPTALQGAP